MFATFITLANGEVHALGSRPGFGYTTVHGKELGVYNRIENKLTMEVNPDWFSDRELGLNVLRSEVDFDLPAIKQVLIDYYISKIKTTAGIMFPLEYDNTPDFYERNMKSLNKTREQVDVLCLAREFHIYKMDTGAQKMDKGSMNIYLPDSYIGHPWTPSAMFNV